MSRNTIEGIKPYVDRKAADRCEPGISHAYMASLATALNHIAGDLDPAWLMGASAFAFRSFINQTFCPSAMSISDWSVLPEAVEQAGYHCVYIERLWNQEELEQERREQAQAAIIEGTERGSGAVVWDVYDDDWGLIVGYSDKKKRYATLSVEGKSSTLAYDRLGRNGIDILSVAIPGEPNDRGRDQIAINSLKAAVAHAEGKEWTERPAYENGLAGYDMWAESFDKWALIVGAGRGERLPRDLPDRVRYYADVHYSARCYARDYLRELAADDGALQEAASCYEQVASCLRPVWEQSPEVPRPDAELLRELADALRSTRVAEENGVTRIKEYLAAHGN
jgi:hypothetical protein